MIARQLHWRRCNDYAILAQARQETVRSFLQSQQPFPSRDGGTGRRSGLKIRRPSGLGGSTPPPGTTAINLSIASQNAVYLREIRQTGEIAKFFKLYH